MPIVQKKLNSEREEAIFKILVLVISGIILYFWSFVAYILIFINWLSTLINNKRDKEISEFIEYWSSSLYIFYRYLSGISNERPFPFNEIKKISNFNK